MNARLAGIRIATVSVVAAALATVGVTLARTAPPVPSGSVPPLYGRLVLPTELPGFSSPVCPLVQTDVGRWANGFLSVDQLRRNGFVAGLRELLHSKALDADGVSSVALFASARGARAELRDELAEARQTAARSSTFPVTAIPGASGFALSSGHASGYNVAFADGRYLYLLGIGFSGDSAQPRSKTQLLAAARALYRRVHGQRNSGD